MSKQVNIDDNLIELVKSIRNRCTIFLYLEAHIPPEKLSEIIATNLEDMYVDCQQVMMDYCTVRYDGSN